VEVVRFAAVLQALAREGDRVLIYMPMIAEAIFAMLACARIGAIHSVVFGGFAAASLATRIDDARPKLMVTADAGMRGGKAITYKHLVDEAIPVVGDAPERVVIDQPWHRQGNEAYLRARPRLRQRWRGSIRIRRAGHLARISEPNYILYTSGPPASPRVCSATPADMAWRWLRRCSIFLRRAGREHVHDSTSAGWWGTPTSCTRR